MTSALRGVRSGLTSRLTENGNRPVLDLVKRLAPLVVCATLVAGAAVAAADDLAGLTNGCFNGDGQQTLKDRVKACSSILADYPLAPAQEAKIRANRAWSFNREKRFSDAQADYDRALQLDPNSDILYNERGFFHLQIGEFDAAIRDYNSALVITPNFAYPLYGRGIVYIRKGNLARGQDDLAAARRLDSSIDVVFRNVGVTP